MFTGLLILGVLGYFIFRPAKPVIVAKGTQVLGNLYDLTIDGQVIQRVTISRIQDLGGVRKLENAGYILRPIN